MKKLKYCFLGLLATFSLGFYSCQNDDVSNSDLTGGSEEVFTVTEAVFTKGSTEILEGKGTYKTGETATLKAAAGATITGTRTRGTGTFGNTYQKDGYAWAEINDIHGDWVVSATLPDPKKYTVTVEAGTGGTVSGGGEVTEGSSCNISATENEGYAFNGWTVTSGTATIGNSNSMNTTVTPSSDCTVTAQFKQEETKYTINYNAYHPNGTCINMSPYGHTNLGLSGVENGSEVKRGSTISVSFDELLVIGGYADESQSKLKFKNASIVSGNNSKSTTDPNNLSIVCDGDVYITANYELNR